MRRLLSPLAAAALAALASAQWDSIPYQELSAVTAEGFLVLHRNADGWNVFSAAAQRWQTIAPASYQVLGTGDWTVVLEGPAGVRGYSARHNRWAPLPSGVVPGATAVGDDVAIVVDIADSDAIEAWGYSAQTNSWSSVGLVSEPVLSDVAVSRFVAGLRDEEIYYGFSARTGQWAAYDAMMLGQNPIAVGNVLVADLRDAFGVGGQPNIAAFSGVHGTWELSPPVDPGGLLSVDHNVAAVALPAPKGIRACAYSAYGGRWIESSAVHDTFGTTISTGANWVLVQEPLGAVRIEAIGAAPAQNWEALPGSWSVAVDDAADYVLVERTNNTEIAAFSGLADGAWAPLAINSIATFETGLQRYAVVRDGFSIFSGFSPAQAAWTVNPLGQFVFFNHGVAAASYFSSSLPFTGFSGRWGAWTPGPMSDAPATAQIAGGTAVGYQRQSGPSVGTVDMFDERCDQWVSFDLGGIATFDPGLNVVLAEPHPSLGGDLDDVFAYSAQRADWTSPDGEVLPVDTTPEPEVEDDVCWFVDSAGQLWAFGAPNRSHYWFQWPSGTEFLVTDPPPGAPSPRAPFSGSGEPGQIFFGFVAGANSCPGIEILGINGLLYVNLAFTFQLGQLGAAPPERVVPQFFPINNPLTRGVQTFWQTYIIDLPTLTGEFGDRMDPGWFF